MVAFSRFFSQEFVRVRSGQLKVSLYMTYLEQVVLRGGFAKLCLDNNSNNGLYVDVETITAPLFHSNYVTEIH